MKKKLLYLFMVMFILSFVAACKENRSSEKTVTVSILPQKFFVEKIAGNIFNVNVMIPPGQSPATYEATARQMKSLDSSIVYFMIGHIPFEKANMARIKAAGGNMVISDTSAGVSLIRGRDDADGRGDHDHEGHDHGGVDPHIWLSPAEVRVICRNMADTLIEIDGKNREVYEKNLKAFLAEIDRLDESVRKKLSPYRGKAFLVFHPSWTYFARDYGFVQIPVEFEGKNPSPAWLKKIIDRANREKIGVLFVQKQFPSEIAGDIAGDIKGTVYQPDPLEENWAEGMKKSSDIFLKAFREAYGE